MGSTFRRSWHALLVLCLLYMDDGVQCISVSGTVCSQENMAIKGGHYTLSNGPNVDSMLIYHCPEGYYPYPDAIRRCQNTGNWVSPSGKRILSSGRMKTSVCKVVECPEPVLENGSISPPKHQYFVNDTVKFECYSGYTLRGSSTRLCLPSGKWTGTTPVCGSESEEDCPDPGTPAGASRVGNTFDIGSKITYTCKSQSTTLIGSKERLCLENGQWTGSEPKCYYQHTYDTAQEIAEAFSATIEQNLKTLAVVGLGDGIQTGKKIDISKDELLNIYIAVDASASINEKNFKQVKNSLVKLLRKISSYEVSPNYEIFFFDSGIKEIVNILDKKKVTDIIEDLEKIMYEGLTKHSGTDISGAFKHICEQITFLQQEAKLKNNPKSFMDLSHVIIIFTDGGYNLGGDPKYMVNEIKKKIYANQGQERDKHLDIYIFAVGPKIYHDGLRDLATLREKEEHYFTFNEEKLEEYFDKILDEENVQVCGLYKETNKTTTRYPWLANMSILANGGRKDKKCLGSLVAPKFILTAAHCFQSMEEIKPKDVIVDIGDVKDRKVCKIIIHPQYNITAKVKQKINEYYDFDVALVELDKEVDKPVYVRPICIPCTKATSGALKLVGKVTCKQQEDEIFKTHETDVAFMTEDKGIFKRKKASAQLLDRRDSCIKHAIDAPGVNTKNPKDAVSDNFLCTGGIEHFTQHIACKGDSGGAVFVERELSLRTIQVGVVSWGTHDFCPPSDDDHMKLSSEKSRDFHINLFKVVPFLKENLGNDKLHYTALDFLDDP